MLTNTINEMLINISYLKIPLPFKASVLFFFVCGVGGGGEFRLPSVTLVELHFHWIGTILVASLPLWLTCT